MFVSQSQCLEELLSQCRPDKYFMSGSWGALLQKNALYLHCTIWIIELQDKSCFKTPPPSNSTLKVLVKSCQSLLQK